MKAIKIENRQSKIGNQIWEVSLILIMVGMVSAILFAPTKGFTDNRGAITIGVDRSPLLALVMIAEDQGFFSKQGVDAKVKYYVSGKLALNGMFSGEVELATPAETPIVFSSFERIDFSIVATIGSSGNEAKIVARKDRGIQKPGDLRGKRIATQKASAVHFFLHSFLVKNGLSDKDIELSFKHPDELVPALANGEIDAFSMREPYVCRAKTSLKDNIVVFEEPGLCLKTYNLVAYNTFIKDRPQVLMSVLQALIKSEEFAEKYPGRADDLGRVKTDPGWVEQIVMNLAVNARDAMPSVGKLTIETANVELDEEYAHKHIAVKPGRYVMLSVSDTGVGMTPEVRQQVFEPFFTTKEKGKGTGLGLSTVYGIVKQSGGNIWVYSEPDKGTTFKIYLPRVDEPLEEIKERVVKEEPSRGSETILLVEDEEAVRKLAVQILKKQGYTVLMGSDGNEAINVCKQHKGPVHLLLTDVVMPGMSGRQLAEQLKQVCQDFKVLYMSGYTDNAITHHGVLEKGMNYLQKPFTVDNLARKVREVLDKGSKPAG